MLEKLPSVLGHALSALRPGLDRLLVNDTAATGGASGSFAVKSPAFTDGGRMPSRYTADGEKLSPPLLWSGVPEKAAALVFVMEDADSPTPRPLVHAIAYDLPLEEGSLGEGALPGPAGTGEGWAMGRNSFFRAEYLPPDPPPGHGPHRYAFEFFALDRPAPFAGAPVRGDLIEALRGHILAKGCIIGVYERP